MNKDLILAKLREYPIALGAALVALVCAATLYLRLGAVEQARQEVDELNQQWDLVLRNDAQSVGLAEQVERLKAVTDEITRRLINPGEKAFNYQAFYRLETLTGSRITSLVQQDAVRPGFDSRAKLTLYRPVMFQLAVQGTFEQTLALLRELQHGNQFVRVERFDVAVSTEATQGANLLRLTMDLDLLGRLQP